MSFSMKRKGIRGQQIHVAQKTNCWMIKIEWMLHDVINIGPTNDLLRLQWLVEILSFLETLKTMVEKCICHCISESIPQHKQEDVSSLSCSCQAHQNIPSDPSEW